MFVPSKSIAVDPVPVFSLLPPPQAFLALVRSSYRGWHIALLLDEDSCHTARASVQAAGNITLLWLPTRAPKLNPIETLWGQAKDVVSANRQYASVHEQTERFVAHLTRHV